MTAQLINRRQGRHHDRLVDGDTVIPVADQCELAGVPCITPTIPGKTSSSDAKAIQQRLRVDLPFLLGLRHGGNLFADMWLYAADQQNRSASLFTNDPDGIAANDKEHGMPTIFQQKGPRRHRTLAFIRR